jgi:hypothetical protein
MRQGSTVDKKVSSKSGRSKAISLRLRLTSFYSANLHADMRDQIRFTTRIIRLPNYIFSLDSLSLQQL